MRWLSKSATVEAPPPLSVEDQLLFCTLELRAIEKTFSEKCFALARYSALHKGARTWQTNRAVHAVVGAMDVDLEWLRLQASVEEVRQRRNELLARRALLLESRRIYAV